MELTNGQVQEVMQAMLALGTEKVPAKFAWKVQTARRTLEPFYKTLLDAIQEIQLKYALRDKAGELEPGLDARGKPLPGTIRIPPERVPIANKELQDLLEQTVTVDNVGFTLADFPESLELTPDSMAALAPLITA